jgi:hypothetical protein
MKETDPHKLMSLVDQLNNALEQREKELRRSRPNYGLPGTER